MENVNIALKRLCENNGLNLRFVQGFGRCRKVALIRRRVAKELYEKGYSQNRIAQAMGMDHTSIKYMLDDDFRETKKLKMKERVKNGRKTG